AQLEEMIIKLNQRQANDRCVVIHFDFLKELYALGLKFVASSTIKGKIGLYVICDIGGAQLSHEQKGAVVKTHLPGRRENSNSSYKLMVLALHFSQLFMGLLFSD